MTKEEYANFIQQARSRCKERIRTAKNEQAETIEAINRLWRMMNNTDTGYGTVSKAVRTVLVDMPEQFTCRDMAAASEIIRHCNPNTLYSCLHRLKQRGVIIEIKRGGGGTRTVFRKAEND